MKKILITILLVIAFAGSSGAQHYVGFKGGFGGGRGRFTPREEMKMVWGLWSGGLQWKYYGKTKYVGAVGAEVEFIQRAYHYDLSRDSDLSYRRVINTVNIPFIWHIHLNMAENRFRVFLNLGVGAQVNLSSRVDTLSRERGVVYSGRYRNSLVRDNPFGYGLLGGVGFNVAMGRWEFAAEGRYYFSFGDILRNRSIYGGDPYGANGVVIPANPRRSPLDNVNITVGMFYRIGDNSHSPEPTSEALRRRAEREARERVNPESAPPADGAGKGAPTSGEETVAPVADDEEGKGESGEMAAPPPAVEAKE